MNIRTQNLEPGTRLRKLAPLSCLLLVISFAPAFAQTQVEPGFNLFSVEQDVQVGRQSAEEVEKQLPILNNRSVERYISELGRRLAREAQGPEFPYQFKVVNTSDINAFALPGGYMYVHRGLIEAARSEAELAGVMAHEIAHVALRHGTNQASKAYLGQAGLGVLGGLLGGSTAGDIIGAVGGFGLNSLFLKYSRNAEEQADIVGAQMLAKAGYDPMAMASFFELLREKAGRDPSGLEEFFSSHPSPADRAERIREEASKLRIASRSDVGNFSQIQRELDRLPDAPSMRELSQGGSSSAGTTTTRPGRIENPSGQMRTFEESRGFFRIQYPANWRAIASDQSRGVTIVPEGGVVQSQDGQQHIVYGVIVNHYDPFAGSVDGQLRNRFGPFEGGSQLERAANDLVSELLRSNRYLEPVRRSTRRHRLDGEDAISVLLEGSSPATRDDERIMLVARELEDDHVIYTLFIAPERDWNKLTGLFEDMLKSLNVNDRAYHQ